MPAKFAALCGRLTKEQVSRVKEIGLECLLTIPSMPIQRIIVEDIAEKYNEGTVLAPCSKEYVSSRYCGIVSNVEELKGYNWAQFTLDFLINHLELFKTSKRTGLVGNLAFLQIWYFEHFQVADDCFDYGLHKRPLIASWGANKVAKRAQLEGVKKSGCAKVVIRLEADDGKVVTLSDNSEEVSHNDHNFEGSHNADDTLQWIKDKLIDFVNDTDSKFSTLLERIERLEDHSTLQGTENTKGSCRTDDETISSIKVKLSALEKDTNDKYTSIIRRIDLMEDRNRCLMQRVLNHLDSVGSNEKGKNEWNDHHETPYTSVDRKNEVLNEGSCQLINEKHSSDRKVERSRRGVKRTIELVKSPSLVEKVKTRRDRQPSKVCKSPFEGVKRKKAYLKKNGDVDEFLEQPELTSNEKAAFEYVQNEIDVGVDKDLVRIDSTVLRCSHMRCLVKPSTENATYRWLGSENTLCNVAINSKLKNDIIIAVSEYIIAVSEFAP
ncbi:hypothetical protein GUJ93_ZPchr0001g30155 [Zizania palustris]|uniref:Aminotransferase-like plant mobile domain-containing protein n=1 Tax=Zizania palustris TaxID=103762 RepID=A0A8J5VUA2_ZIZPA|nr:hypothetical protein GUJ93_ZPchr0001g30155 [Zizania palustris]